MKIVSFHYPRNYGAFLQAYALQNVSLNAEHIDFIPGIGLSVGEYGRKKAPFFWRVVAFFRWLKKDHKFFPEIKKLRRTFRCRNESDLKKMKISCNEVLVAGSDQIWNPALISLQESIYFLNFGEESCRRIAYAASLGVKSWPDSFVLKVLPFLRKFDAISVREESSVAYLNSLGLRNVASVCDPTLLHDVDFYRKRFLLFKKEEKKPFVYKIREPMPENVQSLLTKGAVVVDLKEQKSIKSVTEWLMNIENASFVITDSFHGTVFCLLFHKPFLVIPNRKSLTGMNERFETLLSKTYLHYRCLSCEESKTELMEKLHAVIDWNAVDAIINEWRKSSIDWLKRAMGN